MEVRPQTLVRCLDEIGFMSAFISSSTTEMLGPGDDSSAVWAIAAALGLVDRGCAMAWGGECSCDPSNCRCVNCTIHVSEAASAVNEVCSHLEEWDKDETGSASGGGGSGGGGSGGGCGCAGDAAAQG
ncbi:unnamed protein product, partial [Phaeothamnion confervicola]